MESDLTRSYYLVRRAKAGERECLNELFTRYYDRVRKIVRVRLGKQLRRLTESDDILQETFASAIKAFDRFELRDEASLIHWLAKIAERTICDRADYFAAKKRTADVQALDETGVEEPPDDRPGPMTLAGNRDQQAQLERALERLPEKYREIIILRDFAGFSWAEVAVQHGRPNENAARMMYATAIAALDRALQLGDDSTDAQDG